MLIQLLTRIEIRQREASGYLVDFTECTSNSEVASSTQCPAMRSKIRDEIQPFTSFLYWRCVECCHAVHKLELALCLCCHWILRLWTPSVVICRSRWLLLLFWWHWCRLHCCHPYGFIISCRSFCCVLWRIYTQNNEIQTAIVSRM